MSYPVCEALRWTFTIPQIQARSLKATWNGRKAKTNGIYMTNQHVPVIPPPELMSWEETWWNLTDTCREKERKRTDERRKSTWEICTTVPTASDRGNFRLKKLLHHNFNPKKDWRESPEGPCRVTLKNGRKKEQRITPGLTLCN